MDDSCFCCFDHTPKEEANPIEAQWGLGDGMRIVTTDLIVCNECRGLECDVLNPEECKKVVIMEDGSGGSGRAHFSPEKETA